MANSSPPSLRDGIAFPCDGADPVRDLAQQSVAHGMTKRIIHRLESVKVQAQHSEWMAPIQLGERHVQPVIKQDTVRQAGQRIMVGEESNTGNVVLERLQRFNDCAQFVTPEQFLDVDRPVSTRHEDGSRGNRSD